MNKHRQDFHAIMLSLKLQPKPLPFHLAVSILDSVLSFTTFEGLRRKIAALDEAGCLVTREISVNQVERTLICEVNLDRYDQLNLDGGEIG